MTRAFVRLAPITIAAALLASPAFAQGAKIDGADTAWMISATGLVLMMTIPGLANDGAKSRRHISGFHSLGGRGLQRVKNEDEVMGLDVSLHGEVLQ